MIDPMAPERWRVIGVRRENHDTTTLEIEPMASVPRYSFAPGQFNMLYVFGVGEVPISMSGDPTAAPRVRHTVRGVGAVTRAISSLKRGAVVGVRGPFGSRWPLGEAAGGDVVVMAGGIGLAPLRPAIETLNAQHRAYKNISVLYGARTPSDLLYRKDLARWHGGFDVEVTVDSASGDWRGNVGVVTPLVSRIDFEPKHTTAMICGPEIMMHFAVRELQQRGIENDRIFLSLERNMKCAVGFCGHCQFGPTFVCKDGPVFSYERIKPWFGLREI